jgi:hypothetical protein
MTFRRVHSCKSIVVPLLIGLVLPPGLMPALAAQEPDKVVALKQSLAANTAQQRQYKWIETTVMSLKGEEKSRIQKQVFYGPDGKLQKQQLTAPPQEETPGGLKGKAIAKKKAEISATMKAAAGLIQQYVPPDPQRIQAAKAAGKLAIVPVGTNAIRLDIHGFVKPNDSFSLSLDTGLLVILTVNVKSYFEKEDEAVNVDVTFNRLRDGLSYPADILLSIPEDKITVVIQNSNYQRIAGSAPKAAAKPVSTSASKTAPASSASASTGAGASTAALDNLTGPIALYPDALIAQILEASKDPAAVAKFAGWLKTNSALKGTALQDAAQKAGFAACYIALAPFPQVVQMMADKPDWTKQLGAAYTTSEADVYLSIQRLRAAAMALGNLKTTPQQEVVTEAGSTGDTIILVQPANPEVIYVPVYNTQVVYVQQAPPPAPAASSSDVAAAALVGFTVGIIIGASSNHYYYGPYAWRAPRPAYHRAYDYREDRYDDRRDYQEDRRDNTQDNRSDRQQNVANSDTAQANQSNRQSTAQSSQSNRQSTAQTNQDTRQTSGASTETAQANQSNRQSTASTNQSSRQSTAQSSSGNRQSAGYSSGGSARAQSSRGSASRGGGGGRRR